MKNPIKQFYKLHYIEKYENYIKSKKVFLAIFLIITNLLGGLVFGYALGTIGGGLGSAITAFFPASTNSNSTSAAVGNQTSSQFYEAFSYEMNTPKMDHFLDSINGLFSIQNYENLNCILLAGSKSLQLLEIENMKNLENCFQTNSQFSAFSTFNSTTTTNSNSTTTSSFDLGTSIIQGLFSAAIFIGGLFGCMFAMASGPLLGRKISIMLCCIISVIGNVGASASYTWATLIVFRCILGFGAGIATAVCSVYCAELMPYAKYQGVLGAMFNMGISLGTTAGYIFGAIFVRSSEMWRAVHAFDNLFVIPLFFIVLLVIPESPMFIHGGSHDHTAVETNGKELNETGTTNDEKKVTEKKAMSTLAAFKRLFCSKAIRGTILACFGCFALEWTGVQSATMFIPSLIASAGVSDPLNQQLVSFGIAVWQIFCILPTIFLIDRLGRKPIIIFGFTMSLVMDLACGFIFQFGEDGSNYKIILCILFICLYLIGFHCGIGSLGYILAHEVFNGEDEKVIVIGTSLATLIMWSTTIVLSLFFIPVVSLTNQAVPWFIFAGISFIGLFLYIFLLKETSPAILAKRAEKAKNPRPEREAISTSDLTKTPEDLKVN